MHESLTRSKACSYTQVAMLGNVVLSTVTLITSSHVLSTFCIQITLSLFHFTSVVWVCFWTAVSALPDSFQTPKQCLSGWGGVNKLRPLGAGVVPAGILVEVRVKLPDFGNRCSCLIAIWKRTRWFIFITFEACFGSVPPPDADVM